MPKFGHVTCKLSVTDLQIRHILLLFLFLIAKLLVFDTTLTRITSIKFMITILLVVYI